MKIFIIDEECGRIEAAVEDNKVLRFASLLENSKQVKSFYIDGLNVNNQQKIYGCDGYTKWISIVN